MTLVRSNQLLGIFALTLCIIVVMGSCNNVRKFKEDRAALLEEKKERKSHNKKEKKAREEMDLNLPEGLTQDTISSPDLLDKKAEGDSLYLSYERTACFGRCPIYKVKIYDSGFSTYEGINFVTKMGIYHTRIEESYLIDIEKTLNDIYFYELEDVYDNPNLSDVPSKIIVVNKPNRKKRIKARTDVPKGLQNLFQKIDGIIDAKVWLPGMVKK